MEVFNPAVEEGNLFRLMSRRGGAFHWNRASAWKNVKFAIEMFTKVEGI